MAGVGRSSGSSSIYAASGRRRQGRGRRRLSRWSYSNPGLSPVALDADASIPTAAGIFTRSGATAPTEENSGQPRWTLPAMWIAIFA
jgi:hypothetical protein